MLAKKKIIWLSFHPNIYNDFLFNTVHADAAFDLEAYFVREVLQTHPWKGKNSLNFKHQEINGHWGTDWHLLWRAATRKDGAYYVVGGWNNPTMFLTISVLAVLNRPFAVWTDTPNILGKRGFLKKTLRQTWLNFVFASHRKSQFLTTGKIGVRNAQLMTIPSHKISDFPFATNLDFFKPSKKSPSEKNLVFISSGRLKNDHKGYHIAIQAFRILKEKGITHFIYKIAGTGPDKAALLNQIKALGLCQHIELLGWVEMNQLLGLYQSADVLLHPSYFDPFPNAVLEAMACGLPVIGSNLAGSVVDRVVHNSNGFLHQAGDAHDLASKIEQIMTHPEVISIMSIEARKTAEAYGVQNNLDTLKRITAQPNTTTETKA